MIVLGIGGGIGHDCSACIVKDGKLLCAAEEERFTRIKRSSRKPPVNATVFCLEQAGIDINDVDCLAIGWNPDKFNIKWPVNYLEEYLSNPLLKREKPFKIVSVGHHVAHLIASYANSGFEQATGIVIDGQGEDLATTIAFIDNRKVKILEQKPISQSLGYFYQGVLRYLHLGRTEAGKLMGLASYGENRYDLPISIDDDGYHMPIVDSKYNFVEESNAHVISWWIDWLTEHIGKAADGDLDTERIKNRALSRVSFDKLNVDLAASAQYYAEQAILATIKRGIQLTNCKNVVYGGGVALN
ncbi:MAG: carbamoyltransferase N-terminal domain-containing protein, partial [Ruminiclostridium sp.]